MSANSLTTNLIVTAGVLLMVFLMPWLDRRLCRRLGLSLNGGVSENPEADRWLRRRRLLLIAVFGLYLAAVAWLVFFSRTASNDYMVHVALFQDLTNAVHIDFGFLGILRAFFTEGPREALSHIRIVTPSGITQVYMNVMLFVPMGYLLPYIFDWFRQRVYIRPAAGCFLISLVIENLQLIFRRGFYDMDDLVSNTLGGLAGQLLYVAAGYVVTHPDWRQELRAFHRYRRHARCSALYPGARRTALYRVTLLATDEDAVRSFYGSLLGFRLRKQFIPMDRPGTDLLMELGRFQLEFRCLNTAQQLPEQHITLSVRSLNAVIRRLRRMGIDPGPTEKERYTGVRCVQLTGPDAVRITVVEEDDGTPVVAEDMRE